MGGWPPVQVISRMNIIRNHEKPVGLRGQTQMQLGVSCFNFMLWSFLLRIQLAAILKLLKCVPLGMTAKLEKGKTEMFIQEWWCMYVCMSVCSSLFTSELLLYHGSISTRPRSVRASWARSNELRPCRPRRLIRVTITCCSLDVWYGDLMVV